ncbi:MAG: hypothetical protein ACI9TH_004896 [Kiritimatiellia bacterium]|jgi:hypothetical protein
MYTNLMQKIRIVKPLDLSFPRMYECLFRPFNAGFWFVAGFAVWLTHLPELAILPIQIFDQLTALLDEEGLLRAFAERTREMAVGGGVLLLLCGILWVALSWLACRAEFIFLHFAVHPAVKFGEAWRASRPRYLTYFYWELAFGLVSLLWMAGVWLGFGYAIRAVALGFALPRILLAALLLGFLTLFLVVALIGYIKLVVKDFILPVMFKHACGIMDAWTMFWPVFKPNFIRFYLYALLKVLLVFLISVIGGALVLMTCCIAASPYIGTVIMMPAFLLLRLYSLHFLAQFGTDFDLLGPPELPAE